MEAKIKLAIADDHPLVIDGLHYILTNVNDIKIVGTYSNGTEMLAGLTILQPDVLLLDIKMPGRTGDELIDVIRSGFPGIKILALTNQDNVFYIKTMLRKGALGYVLKTTRKDILLDAIRTVANGSPYIETSLAEKIHKDSLEAKKRLSAIPELSRREHEVLNYIARDFTSKQIAEALFISKRTVDFHRQNLIVKLGVKNVGALVKRGIQLGLIN